MRSVLILASTLALLACNIAADAQDGESGPPGPMTQRSYDVGSFDGVALGGHYNVVVQVGPAISVRAEGPADELDRLRIEVEDGDLQIERRRKWKMYQGSRGRPVTVYVTMPTIANAAIGGSGDIRIDQIRGEAFEAAIGGSGDIDISRMEVGKASFSVAGSGSIRAAGSAGKSDISIAGSGDVRLEGLKARNASVSIAGSGGVHAYASDTADVSIIGSGDVAISGSAKCNVSKMGSGSVRCGA